MNRSLTVLSYDCLTDATCTYDEAHIATLDLADHAPGPLQIEQIPGLCEALVTISPGFFGSGAGGVLIGSPDVPDGGGLLRVDLASGDVIAEISTSHTPMGLAISGDASTAYTANYGRNGEPGNTMSVIDLADNTETVSVTVGNNPEQVVLSTDGWGLINAAADDSVQFFQTTDPSGTLTAPIDSGNDPSDVEFVDDRALVVNSLSFTLSVFDVSDRSNPTKLEDVSIAGGAPYAVTRVPGTGRVLLPASSNGSVLIDLDVSTTPAVERARIDLAGGRFPIGAAVDDEGAFAFVAHPQDHVLSVVDLGRAEARGISWADAPGPTYVIFVP